MKIIYQLIDVCHHSVAVLHNFVEISIYISHLVRCLNKRDVGVVMKLLFHTAFHAVMEDVLLGGLDLQRLVARVLMCSYTDSGPNRA